MARVKWKLDLVHLEIVLILTRRMVYAKPTICLEVILDTTNRTAW